VQSNVRIFNSPNLPIAVGLLFLVVSCGSVDSSPGTGPATPDDGGKIDGSSGTAGHGGAIGVEAGKDGATIGMSDGSVSDGSSGGAGGAAGASGGGGSSNADGSAGTMGVGGAIVTDAGADGGPRGMVLRGGIGAFAPRSAPSGSIRLVQQSLTSRGAAVCVATTCLVGAGISP
jgi:hypothetical protein